MKRSLQPWASLPAGGLGPRRFHFVPGAPIHWQEPVPHLTCECIPSKNQGPQSDAPGVPRPRTGNRRTEPRTSIETVCPALKSTLDRLGSLLWASVQSPG